MTSRYSMKNGDTGYRFSAPPRDLGFNTLLFDMDGTIIDSTPAVVKHWHEVGNEIGVDGDVILKTSHGRRSIDVLQILAPHLANWDYVCEKERQIPIKHGEDAHELPGARALLDKLSEVQASWGVVTSGTRPLVSGWLDRLSLAVPEALVTAEDVARGKPDPACYILGAKRVASAYGWPVAELVKTVVFEDAPAGIKAGRDAGFVVVALATTHSLQELWDACPTYIVQNLASIEFVGIDETNLVTLRIKNALWTETEEAAMRQGSLRQ